MSQMRYAVPECIRSNCNQARYSRWLHAKAVAHTRRDRKRFGEDSCTIAGYKAAIHAAVAAGGDKDYYTGEVLDWARVSTYENAASKEGKVKYKKEFALLPTLDHTFDEHGQQKFVICSWRVNDMKGDMSDAEFYQLCALVLKYRSARNVKVVVRGVAE